MPIPAWVTTLIITGVYLIVALVLRKTLLSLLTRASKQSATRWDDVTLAAVKGPTTLLILVSALWLAAEFSTVRLLQPGRLDQVMRVGAILSVLWFTDRFIRTAIEMHAEALVELHLTSGVARTVARVTVLMLGGLVILDTLNISITPLLASLGVGGLAIGLALQGTLADLFAGMQIVSDRPIRIGDFVKLESGEEGFVTEIGWRTTRIRALPNVIVVIPNSKLADSLVSNYTMPDPEMVVLVQVGVSYSSDLAHVERVTIDVARDIQQTVTGAVPTFEPFIRYHTFNSSSIDFSVIMRASQFTDNFLMKHEFIKQLQTRYRAEGIVIPFPIRTLDMPEELTTRLHPPRN